jgi:ribosome-associated translation inhibitor RaiA
MPDGVVQWFDASTGQAAVVRKGRRFSARITDVEPVARRAGARVHFDIHRDHGVETAVDVRLREGTRVSHTHHNFGTLVGARRAENKGVGTYEHMHPGLERVAKRHPLEVARAWASSVADGDIDGALVLCSPDAIFHSLDGQAIGGAAARGFLEATPVFGSRRIAKVRGLDGEARVDWDPAGPDEPAASVRCRITHGQIVEQWIEEPGTVTAATLLPEAPSMPTIVLASSGAIGEEDKRYASERILALADAIEEPILFARVKLGRETDPARARRATVQVALDVNGDPVRAHVAGHTLHEAIDLVQRRLRDRIEHRSEHRASTRHVEGLPESGEWRHGDRSSERPPFFPRPVEQRQLVRHKTFTVDELTPDEAVYDMEQLDYDFHLFCDLASGADSVIERVGGDSYRLTRLAAADGEPGPIAAAVEVSDVAVPEMDVDEAIERLDAGAEPFVFFADRGTGRGNVVYRRYDGHYGLITPQ